MISKPKLVVITGPTASGKSAYGLALAERLGGEIVSADSMQVYREFDIGTAKPSPEERARVPHHLVDLVGPEEPYHVARYRADAGRAVEGILARNTVPVVVGGTALYLKALLQGLTEGPGRDEGVRRVLEARWDAGERTALWDELRQVDPVLTGRLHPNDRTRVVRGLEVWRTGSVPLSSLQDRHGFSERPYEALILGMDVDREELCRRIDARTLAMIADGWVQEVRELLAAGCPPDAPPLRAIGYRELTHLVLRGGRLEDTVARIQGETRKYAKRQMTWLRRMDVTWTDPRTPGEGLSHARKFLQNGSSPI